MDVKLPALGEGADSGTVVNLFVKEGDTIAQDQPVLELENEKAVATIPSTAAGTVSKVFVKIGDKVGVGQKIISVSGGREPSAGAARPGPETARPSSRPEPPAPAPTGPVEPERSSTLPKPGVAAAASPSIRRLARELGIDLSRVPGSARGGRIELSDVRAHIQRLERLAAAPGSGAGAGISTRPVPESIDFSKWGSVVKKPFSPLRQVIARRMSESWNTIPHVTQFDEADITGLLELRKKHVGAYEKQGARLTVTGFVLKTVVAALKQHPLFNSSLDEATQEIVLKNYYHLGMAVDTDAGLIVPVIRNVDQKDLLTLSKELEELAVKARERKVTAEELKGGTFTISNQGGIGGGHFTPIVNRPEVAILGLGRALAKPVARGGAIEIRTMMPLGLSYDHRVIDGGAAARFIVDLVKGMENWNDGMME